MKALTICRQLFERLNTQNVSYCHWKSNARLHAGLMGDADLDLLLDPVGRDMFNRVLTELKFKRIVSPAIKSYPGMEDYLGFDSETGRLVHLHVHYQLVLGERYLKNHHLPLESLVLENCKTAIGVRIPETEIELLLLSIRACMKMGWRGVLMALIRGGRLAFPADICQEFIQLTNEWDGDRFREIVSLSGLPLPADRMVALIEGFHTTGPARLPVLQARAQVFKKLRPYRRTHPLRLWGRRLRWLWQRMPLPVRFRPDVRKRLSPVGRCIALVGADGSGKSTLVRDLHRWLNWKVAVRRVYFGIPKTRGLKAADYGIRLLRLMGRSGPRAYRQVLGRIANMLSARRWIRVAEKRVALFERLKRHTAAGAVVLADRYPLEALWTTDPPMDGPKISSEMGPAGASWAATEKSRYDSIGLPDRIFVLKTDIEALRRRKDDLPLEQHRRKAQAVNAVPESRVVQAVDGDRDYETVLREIKTRIWEVF